MTRSGEETRGKKIKKAKRCNAESKKTNNELSLSPEEPEAKPVRAPELRLRPVGTAATDLRERTPRVCEFERV